jgi:archaellum component FlaC
MTNENKKINELVENDSEPTSECEALTARQFDYEPVPAPPLEIEERTHAVNDVETVPSGPDDARDADPAARTEIIERLRYELEQLRSRWLGLKAEIQSREELAARLDNDLHGTRSKLEEAAALLGKRDATLERLRTRIEAQNVEYENLKRLFEQTRIAKTELESGGEISAAREQLVRYEGAVAGLEATLSGLRDQQRQTESYADTLRRQLSDLRADSRSVFGQRDALRVELANTRSTITTLQTRLAATVRRAEIAESALAAVRDVHEQELRLLRFELSEAQETLAESTQVTEQLACDLAQNRGHRIELERVLTDHDQQNQDKIESLQKQVGQLEKTLADYERKLETKSSAITALMNELSRQSSAATSEEIDDQTLLDTQAVPDSGVGRPSPGDRVTRLLIGHFGKQELRFPLFKNRLTIGRTRENDIYLKAEFISRHHAVIVTDSQATRIIDWGSKNGVYVNSKRVTEHFLKSGDRIRIGSIEFRYEELPRRESA